MIDLNHGTGPLLPTAAAGPNISAAVNAAIDAGLEAKAAQEPARNYLGASQLGDPCLRKLAMHYRRAARTNPGGRMRRIWQRGHDAEDRMIRWLRLAGFQVVDRDKSGQQLRFKQAGGKISGGCDGVVISGPVAAAVIPYPVLLELKCLNSKSWNDLVKKGLYESKEVYWAQIHLYMAYFNLSHCLFGAENADSEELVWFLIPYDAGEAQRVSDRGVQILLNGDRGGAFPPRISLNRDFYMCRFCEFSDACWSLPE